MKQESINNKVRNFIENVPEDFENKFREWWSLVMENHIEHSPGDFDCIEEIDLFLDDPNTCLRFERKFKKDMDKWVHKQMLKDIKSGAFKPETGWEK